MAEKKSPSGCLQLLLFFGGLGVVLILIFAIDAPKEFGSSTGSGGKANSTPTLVQRYPGPWREDFNSEISMTLAANHVTGCGQLKWRSSAFDSGEYLVYCTADGNNWTAYLVWGPTKKVQGPFTPDPSLR